jgi:phenylalanine-4-hydroxylase
MTDLRSPGSAQTVTETPPAYWDRREEIAALAAGVDAAPTDVMYSDVEHGVWSAVTHTLGPLWDQHASQGVLAGRDRLGLPTDRVPQLREVDAWLHDVTGFGYRAVAGILPADEFFDALARRIFPSTQYLRYEGTPLYTPEPDVIHEVMGHGNCLACPEVAELHRLAGEAVGRVETARACQFLADVFWFTVEFGVVRERGAPKAFGAGLLSSPGELGWFRTHADIRPLDLVAMGTIGYDIHRYQPVLFEGRSLQHVLDVVGEFSSTATDDSIAQLLSATN